MSVRPRWSQCLAAAAIAVASLGLSAGPSGPTRSVAQAESISLEVPPPARQASGTCRAQLGQGLDATLDSFGVANSEWGIAVKSLQTGRTLYRHNAQHPLIPASNTKLLTVAAAFRQWDPPLNDRHRARVKRILRYSDNSLADSLLSGLGGPQVASRSLSQLGLTEANYRQADGSGLSRRNAVTASSLVSLLAAMPDSNHWALFYSSLPVAGQSGTLSHRLQDTAASGQIRAKTGTLHGVRALSGYAETADFGRVAFSILANNPNGAGSRLVAAIDKIALQLAQLQQCQQPLAESAQGVGTGKGES